MAQMWNEIEEMQPAGAELPAPQISLILATKGRTEELRIFLRRLEAQTCRDFELLVVDQNEDDRLVTMLEEHAGAFPLFHLRSRPGLSRARNVGLQQARGTIVAIPDDDCWYPATLLEEVKRLWAVRGGCGGLITGRGWDGVPPRDKAGLCTRSAVWKKAGSIFLFLRRELVVRLGGFDESLGLGPDSRWPGGEDCDLVLRILAEGEALYYEPRVWVGHPGAIYGRGNRPRGHFRGYGAVAGYLMGRYRFPWWYFYARILRTAGGVLVALVVGHRGHAAVRWDDLRGRIEGWRAWRADLRSKRN